MGYCPNTDSGQTLRAWSNIKNAKNFCNVRTTTPIAR